MSRMIHTFLPVLHKLKDPAILEICFSTLQLAMHSCVDYVIILIDLACQIIFQDPRLGAKFRQYVGCRSTSQPFFAIVCDIRLPV